MQHGRGQNTSSGGVGTLSAWGLAGLRSSLALRHRPEMAGGHRHLTYTWRVYTITYPHIAPLDLFSHMVTFLLNNRVCISPFFSLLFAPKTRFWTGSMMNTSSRDPLPTVCFEIVKQVRLLLTTGVRVVRHTHTHLHTHPSASGTSATPPLSSIT